MIATRIPHLLLLTTSLVAQSAGDNRFVPADAQLVVRIASPAKWHEQFADTKVAQVLGSQALAPMLGQLQRGIDQRIEAIRSSGKIDADLIEGFLKDYKGDIVLALQLDFEDMAAAIEDGRPPAMGLSLTLTPDGAYDLGRLATALCDLAEDEGGDQLRDVTVGEHTLRCVAGEDSTVALPKMIDDQFVMIICADMEREAAPFLAKDNRHQATGAGKAFHAHIEAKQAIGALFDVVQRKMESDIHAPPIDMIQVLTDLGFGCLRSFDFSVTAEDRHAVIETDLHCDAEDRGLFASFMRDQGTPRLLRYVPPAAESFACQAFDVGAIIDTIEKVWGSFEGVAPFTFDEALEMFAEKAKVRLRQDLIDHLGTDMLYLENPDQDELEAAADGEGTMLAGVCLGLALRNGAAFGESLEKALRSNGLHAARKSEEYQGVTIYRLRVGPIEIEYAVTPDLLLLAPGSSDSAGRQLRAVLDARADPEAGLPANVTRHTEDSAPGWNGLGVTNIARTLSSMEGAMNQLPPGGPPGLEMVFSLLGTIGKEMAQVGLDSSIQLTWSSATRMRTRTRL
ncbi:MAG: hypothetical protein KDC98_06180 [Planctomycetes bacterium]|nr:hypothetical protein [Planctomycetota bacterium]